LANTSSPFNLPNNAGLLINADHQFPDFDIPDTQALNIELLINEEVIDTFSADTSRVQKRDDGQMSFQKVLLPDKVITTNSRDYITNNKRGYAINP
jgi:hypothetical protein